jgi:cytochrome P450
VGLPGLLWLSWRDPLRIWSERHFDEPVLYGEGRLGRAMTVSDPAAIRHVLVDNARAYVKGPVQRRVLGPLLGEGLLLAEGEDWRRARRTLAPLFTPRRTQAMAAKMRELAEARAVEVAREARGGAVDIDSQMTRLTFEILSATLFSDALGGAAAEFERALNGYIAMAARVDPLDVVDAPPWVPRLGRVLAGGQAAFFERRVAELAARRRALIAAGETAPDDLMSALIGAHDPETGAGLSERQVAANILTFILAGHETTARTLSWTLHLLSRSPDTAERVAAEGAALDVGAPGWEERAPWTRASLEEAMRLFPPAPLITRAAVEEDVVAGRRVPPDTTILISPWVLHRHRRLWDEPDAFRPERFLPGAREAIDRFAFIPFGGGPRVCIGAAFAMQEAMIALAVLARTFRFEPAGRAEPVPQQRITLRARGGLKLKAAPR